MSLCIDDFLKIADSADELMKSKKDDPPEQLRTGVEILNLLTSSYGPLMQVIYKEHGIDLENTTKEDFDTIK